MNFLILLVAHWVGDYVLQTSPMATKKHKSLKWLLLHVLTYTVVLLGLSQFVFSWQVGLGYAVFNGALHLTTDFFTSKLAAKFQENPRVFYPVLGFDQLIHISCLYWTFINSDILAL
ncbi:MAG: DUF3307 domain-containing protein [Bacteroidota bacterium]